MASGGELSRIALAIAVCSHTGSAGRAAQADATAAPTLIFDEIDAGIGGAVGDTVGRLMRRLGRQAQVLSVTHLPQVAACADHHFVVSKTLRGRQARTTVAELPADQVVAELVRMLGADAGDLAARRHAKALLSAA